MGITELLWLWFIVSVREWGALISQGTVWEHRGQAGVGTAESEGDHLFAASLRWGESRNLSHCWSWCVTSGEEFWRMAGTQCLWTAHLPRSWHCLQLGPWGCWSIVKGSPIQTGKLFSSSCYIFTKCVNVCTDKVWNNVDQVWWAA